MFLKDNLKTSFGEKNILLATLHIGFTFFFIFSAFMALQSIEASLNYEGGRGALSLSLLFGVNFVSALFIGPPLIHFLTPKWVMFMCFFAHTFFIIAHFWSSWALLMSSSFLLGVFFSPVWVANGTYITVLSLRYAEKTGKKIENVLQLLNSIFYMLYSLSGVPGNIASSLILQTSYGNDDCNSFDIASLLQNNTGSGFTNSSDILEFPECLPRDISACGPDHCPYIEEHTEHFDIPDKTLLYILLGCFLAFNVIGLVLCATLPSGIHTNGKFSPGQLCSVLMILKRRRMQMFAVPLFVTFVNDTLFYGTFLPSFVGCTYGLGTIGYAAIMQALGFFVVTVTFSLCSHQVAQLRQQIFSTAILANAALMLTWLLWKPGGEEQGDLWITLLLSAIHGLVHGVYKIEVGAMTSLLFPDAPEAAFSIYNLAYTTATSFTFGLSFILCLNIKMYIYFALLGVMAVVYSFLESSLRKDNSASYKLDK